MTVSIKLPLKRLEPDLVFLCTGVRRFLQDIECMIGNNICGCMPFWLTKYWWALMWCAITPAGVTVSTCLHVRVISTLLK